MILPDVNVLLAAHRAGHAHHAIAQNFLKKAYEERSLLALCDVTLSALIRLATHPRIFDRPSTFDEAFGFVEELRGFPGAMHVSPGPDHWKLFENLCRSCNAIGGLVTDAWLAALAMEHGCRVATFDRDFDRFKGLRKVRVG